MEVPFYDLDNEIEAAAGMVIPDIFAEEGEAGFRQRECEALNSTLEKRPGVVALGGGALLKPNNREKVESYGKLICLSADFETILERLRSSEDNRPLLEGNSKLQLKALLDERTDHYLSFPNQVDTNKLSVEEFLWQVEKNLGYFPVNGMGKRYDVIILPDSATRLCGFLAERGIHGPTAVITDDNVAKYHADTVVAGLRESGVDPALILIPSGEENKTIGFIQRILDQFVEAGLDRSSTVVALGGGVIGDMVGFAAAIYLRGISWVGVPTSLLAMVDASLGGKTGVDLPQGKNLVGAFHPPRLVLVDPKFLTTLPEIELRNGMAEVIKHGIIADAGLFRFCQSGWTEITGNIVEVVSRAAAVKVKIIEQDPYEQGRRATLNLGHTLGHGLEIVTNFKLKHGEAVSIGMVAAARLAEKRGIANQGIAKEIEECLYGVGLPTGLPAGMDHQKLKQIIKVDKKRHSGKLRIVLPVRIGEVIWGIEIDDPAELIDVMR